MVSNFITSPNGRRSSLEFLRDDGRYDPRVLFLHDPPKEKKPKTQKNSLTKLKGDYVVTIGGAHGEVAEMEGDTFYSRSRKGGRIRFNKSAISMEATKVAAGKKIT